MKEGTDDGSNVGCKVSVSVACTDGSIDGNNDAKTVGEIVFISVGLNDGKI